MDHEHVIHGLLRKRQEIAAALDAMQGQVYQLIQDIDAVDATLRLFQPGGDWSPPATKTCSLEC